MKTRETWNTIKSKSEGQWPLRGWRQLSMSDFYKGVSMSAKKIRFVRKSLYDEIWIDPHYIVAKRYNLSDNGLRKICIKLDIPLPSRSYRSKIACGVAAIKTPLHETQVDQFFVHVCKEPSMDDELSRRILELRNACGTPEKIKHLLISTDSFTQMEHEEVEQIKKEISSGIDKDGLIQLMHRLWADISISETTSKRSTDLLNKFVYESKQLGIKFNLSIEPKASHLFLSKKRTESKRGYFELYGERFYVRIKEKVLSETIQIPIERKNKKNSV